MLTCADLWLSGLPQTTVKWKIEQELVTTLVLCNCYVIFYAKKTNEKTLQQQTVTCSLLGWGFVIWARQNSCFSFSLTPDSWYAKRIFCLFLLKCFTNLPRPIVGCCTSGLYLTATSCTLRTSLLDRSWLVCRRFLCCEGITCGGPVGRSARIPWMSCMNRPRRHIELRTIQ